MRDWKVSLKEYIENYYKGYFLGLGAKPPTAEWGSMMSEARGLLQTVPWAVFAPGFAIFAAVMVFNLLGDAVRDWIDPKMRIKS